MLVLHLTVPTLLACLCFRGHINIESSHSLHQHDAMLQTNPLSTLNFKMQNLSRIYVYISFKSNIKLL